ncbi:MAG: FtsX-like permease family protein [Thermoanaerobaculia bacterium]
MSVPFARILSGLVLRPLVREPLRTLLTVAGIAVGVSVIVAIQLANRSAIRSFSDSIDAVSGRANYQIIPSAGELDEAVLRELTFLWEGGGRFAPVIDTEAVASGDGQPIRLLAVDLMSDIHFRDYRWARISTGESEARTAAPENPSIAELLTLFTEGSAVVPLNFAEDRGLGIGHRIEVRYRDRVVPLTVRGILHPEGPATAFNGSLIILDIAVAQHALGLTGRLSRIDLILPEPVPAAMRRSLEQALPAGALLERPSRRNDRVDRMLRAFRVNLFALAAVALLVGVFLVYNTVLISILRRRRDIGVFKTLGVAPAQIFLAFLAEGATFGAIGSILGVGLGWLLATGAVELVGRTVSQLYVAGGGVGPVEMTPLTAISGLAVGLIVSIAASAQPALEAARLRPSAMIRPGLYVRLSPSRTSLLGGAAAACFALAWLLSRLGPIRGLPLAGYAAVVALIAGFSLLAPGALQAASRGLEGIFARLFGVPGRLAASSIPASLRRTAVATAALSTAIAMMVSVAVMIGSFRDTVDDWVAQTVQSDLWIRPAAGLSNSAVATLPPELVDQVRAMPQVASVDRFRGREVIWNDTLITVGSGELRTSLDYGSLPMVAPSSSKEALATALEQRGVFVSESLALKNDLDPGEFITVPTPGGPERFVIAGIYRDYSSDRGVIVMDRSVWLETFGDEDSNTVSVYLREGVDPETARREIERAVAAKYSAFVMTNATIRENVLRIFDQTFLITWALLAVALTVAVLAVVNTLTAMILERRREIALLRVLGLDRKQLSGMIILEASILGIVAGVLGLICGWLLSAILIFVINRQSFGWTIEFSPPGEIVAISLAVTILATIVSGLIPAQLAGRIPLATELKAE